MLSLGAVVVKEDHSGELMIGESFYVEIRPTAAGVDPGAMAVNGLDLEDLKVNGRDLPEALASLNRFVEANVVDGTKPVFVGHNAVFDWSYVAYSYVFCGIENPFGYKALDTKALASGVLGLHWFDSNKERLAEVLSLPKVDDDKVHRADYDAWYQAHILIQLLEWSSPCVDS
jgi:DNA polymerase III epsilon subunit-like protein